MYIRFYIDMNAHNEVVDAVRAHFRQLEQDSSHMPSYGKRLHGFNFRQNEEGTYVEYDHFLMGVPTALTKEAGLNIRRVEMYEDFPRSWRDDDPPKFLMPRGVYKHPDNDAQAIVDEFQRGDGGKEHMRLRVVATTLEDAVMLFNLIRKGEIEPAEPWIDAPKAKPAEGNVLTLTIGNKEQ
ncbi:MAG TPA: hypothetical protein VLA88_05990 [Candidatus Saccharimonadales bacterium]|nr:hypothetical protein [Candidatus Saccharimonadales bacterium]